MLRQHGRRAVACQAQAVTPQQQLRERLATADFASDASDGVVAAGQNLEIDENRDGCGQLCQAAQVKSAKIVNLAKHYSFTTPRDLVPELEMDKHLFAFSHNCLRVRRLDRASGSCWSRLCVRYNVSMCFSLGLGIMPSNCHTEPALDILEIPPSD